MRKRGPGRPTLPDSERRTVVAVRVPPATLAQLDALAVADGDTRSGVVERLVADETARRGRRR